MSADKLVSTINDFKKSLNGSTIKIHNNDYATVALRIGILRRNLGTAATISSTLEYQDEKKVIVKAQVFIDDKLVSTGLAEELRAASRINQNSALENAETSAVGRALAFCAFISDGIASAEEVSTAIEQQDKKIQSALKELNSVSHAGNYQEWISKNKVFLSELKSNNPMIYQDFMEKFTSVKSHLQTRGVI